jgi:hypothetical protein
MPPPPQRDWSPPTRTGHGAGRVPGDRGGLGGRPGDRGGLGGRPGGGPQQDRGAAFFAFARAWGAGIAVLLVTEYLQVTLVYQPAVGRSGPESFGTAMAAVHLPNMVCVALATWAAARMHPAPQRERPLRHAVAACTVPVAGQLLMLASLRERPGIGALGFWLSTAVVVTGCVLGMAADHWRRTDG